MKANEKYIIELGDHWRVAVKTPDGRKVKCYSFNKWGGKSASFTLALKWRDEILKKYDLTDRLKYLKSPDLFTCGSKIHPIIGVYQTCSNQNTKPTFNWCANIQRDKTVTKRHFSINKYGNKTAFLMACRARFKNSGKLVVINPDVLPCKPDVPFKYHRLNEV